MAFNSIGARPGAATWRARGYTACELVSCDARKSYARHEVCPLIQPRALWWKTTQSLWFLPAVMVVAAVLLAVGLVEAEAFVHIKLGRLWPRVFGVAPDGARGMLTAIAGSMITVAGVVFSVTIVALSLAASQYSPRVLRTFSSDRPTQLVLGVFVAIFVYCLVVLRTIRGGDTSSFVPSLAVLGGLVLALVGTGFLIFFIHHMAESIQPSSILSRVGAATLTAIDALFPEDLGSPADELVAAAEPDGPWGPVPAPTTGYVVNVSNSGLLAFAEQCGRVVRMEVGIGDFVIEGRPLAWLSGDGAVTRAEATALARNYSFDRQRTLEQDTAYGLQQIVDIASKALSPGINDASTAVLCVDRLTQLLLRIAMRQIETPLRESHGELRIVARGPTFRSLVEIAYGVVRADARGNAVVLARLLWSLEQVGAVTTSPARREVLAEVAERTAGALQSLATLSPEQSEVLARARTLRARLLAPLDWR